MLMRAGWQVTAEAVKILKVVEKCSSADVKFDFQEHLLGGVSLCILTSRVRRCFTSAGEIGQEQ